MSQGPREWKPTLSLRKRGVERFEKASSLVIVAPEWFLREDFQAWRSHPAVASWQGGDSEEQDTFTLFVDGQLRDAGFLPKDIETTLNRLVSGAELEDETVVIWIKAV